MDIITTTEHRRMKPVIMIGIFLKSVHALLGPRAWTITQVLDDIIPYSRVHTNDLKCTQTKCIIRHSDARSTHAKWGPCGQNARRTIFLATPSFSLKVRGAIISWFALANSALQRPTFFAMAGPTLATSGWVRESERVHSETYAFSSHWPTS